MSYDPADNLLDSKRAVLPWCSGRIATFTKLPVRVRFPSATPCDVSRHRGRMSPDILDTRSFLGKSPFYWGW